MIKGRAFAGRPSATALSRVSTLLLPLSTRCKAATCVRATARLSTTETLLEVVYTRHRHHVLASDSTGLVLRTSCILVSPGQWHTHSCQLVLCVQSVSCVQKQCLCIHDVLQNYILERTRLVQLWCPDFTVSVSCTLATRCFANVFVRAEPSLHVL